ncbi:MAG: LacI family DNA-binding transcriptional regulator [Anaerolineales bacterium]|nr:LacI family DNA-binding transcriptional regulator [Anaerolineales bacterium]
MPTKKRTVTIQDVAKKAGVSVSTVSRVLNGKADVAGDTQEKILGVISKLGYTSNLAARSMRSRRKDLLGLVVPDIGFPYSIEVMKGINRAIAESTFDLLVYTMGDVHKSGAVLHEQHYVSLLNNSLTDGVIIVASAAAEFITDAPIIAVDPHIVNPRYPSVQGTNYQGAVEVMQYLLKLGHERIGFICGRPEIASAERRLKGYKDALKEAGIAIDKDLIVPGDFTTKSGYASALQLLNLKHPPTAIFAANDQSALGVFQAAQEMELRIPEDLSVVGFDNIAEAKYVGLTTVDQFLSEMGYIATQMLIKMVNHQPLDVQVHKMPTRLVERTSCRALVQVN